MQYYKFAYGVAYSYLFDKGAVEDVLQEVFLVAYQKYDTLQHHPNVHGWIVKVIKHKANKFVKNDLPLLVPMQKEDDYGLLEILPHDFPKQDAQLLKLYYEQRHNVLTLSAMYHISPTAIRVRLFRARAKLKQVIDEMKGVDIDA